jgi:DNA-binding MarR family transcriptional regulator
VVLLLELQRATHATLHRLAADPDLPGLAANELNALANLAAHPGGAASVSALGAAIGGRPTTLTGVLDRLAGRGLLAREPHERDRRTVVVRLTPDGSRVAGRILDAMAAIEREALAGLPPEAAGHATAVLRALAAS